MYARYLVENGGFVVYQNTLHAWRSSTMKNEHGLNWRKKKRLYWRKSGCIMIDISVSDREIASSWLAASTVAAGISYSLNFMCPFVYALCNQRFFFLSIFPLEFKTLTPTRLSVCGSTAKFCFVDGIEGNLYSMMIHLSIISVVCSAIEMIQICAECRSQS